MTAPSETLREDLTASLFEPYVGSPFTLWRGDTSVAVRLDAVERVGGSDDSFALAFHSPEPFGQGTYPVEHAEAGRMALFLVPVAQDAHGVTVEAVFNRAVR